MFNSSGRIIGIVTGLIIVCLFLILFYIFQQPAQGRAEYAAYVIYIGGIVLALYQFRQKYPQAGFKACFNAGFNMFIMVTFLLVLYTLIFHLLNPQIMESMLKENNAALLKDGSRTPNEIAENAEKIRSLFVPFMIMGTLIKYLVIGGLVTAIAAGFFTQNNTAN